MAARNQNPNQNRPEGDKPSGQGSSEAATQAATSTDVKASGADADKDPKPTGGENATKRDFVRVACSLPNAGTVINGIVFAHVKLGDDDVHVSARVSEQQAAGLLRVPGYAVWDGDEDEYARTIEDALRRNAEAIVGTPEAAMAAESLELEELRRANRTISADLVTARRLNEEQADTIRQLRDEIEALKERGARAA